jgi:tetratricopeptide (TPR) repeat protein
MEQMSAETISSLDKSAEDQVAAAKKEIAEVERSLRETFENYRANEQHYEAISFALGLLKTAGDSPVIWMEYGRTLKLLGMIDHAIFCFRHASQLNPSLLLPTLLVGHCLVETVDGFTAASRGYSDKLNLWHTAIDDVLLAEMFNLGLDLSDAGFFEEAIACHQHVLKFRPAVTPSHHVIATSLLAMNRFEEAGTRLQKWYEQSVQQLQLSIWRGEDLEGKTLLVYADHGLGDTLQFYGHLPALAERCKKLYFRVGRNLWRIIGTHPKIELITDDPDDYDYICSLYMLPHIGGFKVENVPNKVPFLVKEPEMVEHWKELLPKDGFRIGIAWQGSFSLLDKGRSIPVTKYAPIARIPGVKLIALQMGKGLEQLESLPDGMEVITLGPDYNAGPDNVVDTAAVMQNLDLIISTDTSVPHIAGALGLPVWTLLRTMPDWRWLKDREDCPWYPTMRLFRQKTEGDWDEVIDRVVEEIEKLIFKG